MQNCKKTEIVQISVFRAYSGQAEATMEISGPENVENFKKMNNPPSPAGYIFFQWHISEAKSGGPKGSTS